MTTLQLVRFAASRWYNEPALQAIEDTEKGTVTVVVGDSTRNYNCTKTTQVYSSENKNVFLLWYPKVRKAVIIYSRGGQVADQTVYTKFPLKEVDFCVNRVYVTDTAGNKMTLNLGQSVSFEPMLTSHTDAFKASTPTASGLLF